MKAFLIRKNMEEFKFIEGFENIYQVSNLNRVRNVNDILKPNGGIIKEASCKAGYKFVGLYRNKKQIYKKVHRLVAQAFIPNPENKPQVNHINGIKGDNRIKNLEWCTQSENMIHAYRTKLQISQKGEKHGRSKLTKKQVLEIRKSKLTQCKLSEIYGVTQCLINIIINRKIWKHI